MGKYDNDQPDYYDGSPTALQNVEERAAALSAQWQAGMTSLLPSQSDHVQVWSQKIGATWVTLGLMEEGGKWIKAAICWMVKMRYPNNDAADHTALRNFREFTGISDSSFSRNWRTFERYFTVPEDHKAHLDTLSDAEAVDYVIHLWQEGLLIDQRHHELNFSSHLEMVTLPEDQADLVLTRVAEDVAADPGAPTVAKVRSAIARINDVRRPNAARTMSVKPLVKKILADDEYLDLFIDLLVKTAHAEGKASQIMMRILECMRAADGVAGPEPTDEPIIIEEAVSEALGGETEASDEDTEGADEFGDVIDLTGETRRVDLKRDGNKDGFGRPIR